MEEQKALSLCIITKNEEASIFSCLKNMEEIVDEIIVVDLNSSDRTPELARQFGAMVYQPEWEDDFSKIMNFCMDHAAGKWVLFLWADEVIPPEQHKELKLLLQNPAAEGYLIDVDGMSKQGKGATAFPAQFLRLLRNRKNYRFRYRSCPYIPDEELYAILQSGVALTCSGETAVWQAEERSCLLRLDIKEHPQDSYVRYLEGIEFFSQERYKESAAAFELALHALGGGYIYAPYLYKYLGICLLALSRHKAAEEVLSEGAFLFPFFTDLLVLRARLYCQLGRGIEAMKDLEICLMLHNTPNACVPVPEINSSEIVNMLEEIRAAQKEIPVTV